MSAITVSRILFTFPNRALLAIWMFVIASGYTIEHQHADGQMPHHHGIGLVDLSRGVQVLRESTTARVNERHRHKILLGVELPPVPCQDGIPGGPSEVVTQDLGDGVCPDRETATPVDAPLETFAPILWNRLTCCSLAPAPRASHSHLSAFALHAVSGVCLC